MDTLFFEDFRSKLNYDVCAYTDIGKRDEQQDSAYLAVADNEVLAVVCDGMGGLNGGALASQNAMQSFVEFCEYYKSREKDWMQKSIRRSNTIVSNLRDEKGNELICGSTLVSTYINNNQLQWVSAGDSRLYLLRKREFVQITTDHNYFQELEKRKKENRITEEEYSVELKKGEQLTSYLGAQGFRLVDESTIPLKLEKNDVVFLCTDGVYRYIDQMRIKTILSLDMDVDSIGHFLVSEIQKRNHRFQDNYTFIIIKVVNE